jgi:hypothetical protein
LRDHGTPEDKLATEFARTYGFEGHPGAPFEIMFSCDGWIVGWVVERADGNARIDQDPHIRVTLGALLQVRSRSSGLLAIVQLDDARVDHAGKHWPVRLLPGRR